MKHLKYALMIAISAGFFLISSIELMQNCLDQSTNVSASTCSKIILAADNAYRWGSTFYQPTIIILLVIVWSFGIRLLKLGQEVKELKERLDV